MKTRHISNLSRRNSPSSNTTSSRGRTILMPCTSISVRTLLFYSFPLLFNLSFWVYLTNPVWTALEAEGFGANLQHYNPLIDATVAKQWNLPNDWRLVAQLVFGSPEGTADEKSHKPIEERVKVFGKQ